MKKYFFISITLLSLFFPILISADRGMIAWPPTVHLEQSAQNAIVAWNGKEEIIILSSDIKSDDRATILEILPLPSNPSEIKEGDFNSFEKLVEIMNKKIEEVREKWKGLGIGEEKLPVRGIEIIFKEKIGAHDITVVKVNDLNSFITWIKNFTKEKKLEVKNISTEFKNGIKNYLKREIKYFVFDVVEIREEKSIKPVIYKFSSDYLYYPILISGISEIEESKAKIGLFLITKEKIPTEIQQEKNLAHLDFYWRGRFGYPVELTLEELNQISSDLKNLFGSSVYVRTFDYYGYLKDFKKDLIFYPKIWKRHLYLGTRGEDVRALQKILINEGYWDSESEATGYFGPVTKNALIKFQEYFDGDILKPLNLTKGTGYFGPMSREFFGRGFSLSF